MSVSVRIPTVLRPRAGGESVVTVAAGTIADVVAGLDAAHPGFASVLLEKDGSLKRFVNLFVGDEDVRYLQGLDTPVPDGSEVVILPAVAGGGR
jgi:molybdopterin converting factor small subunit